MDELDKARQEVFDEVEKKAADIDFTGPPKEVIKEHLIPRALEGEYELLGSSDERVRQNAIDSVLDRGEVERKKVPEKGDTNILAIAPDMLKGLLSGMGKMIEDNDEKTVYEQRVDGD